VVSPPCLSLPKRCADAPAGDGGAEEPSRAVAVLQLLAAVLEDSPSNRQSLAQLSGAPRLRAPHARCRHRADLLAACLGWGTARRQLLSAAAVFAQIARSGPACSSGARSQPPRKLLCHSACKAA